MNRELRDRLSVFWREWRTLVILLVVMILFRSAVADWNQVPTGSMKPTILEGDRVVVNKLAYGLKLPFTRWQLAEWAAPKAGDIVTFHSPRDDTLLIKRVIGVPGDVVSMKNNGLYVNGNSATYTRLNQKIINQLDTWQRTHHAFFFERFGNVVHPIMRQPAPPRAYGNFAPVEIPPAHYLMLGDNRDQSVDSRVIGLVTRDRITGRAHTVAFSVDYEDWYLPRKDRFLRPLQ